MGLASRLAFVFPGQGSQGVGMGKALAESSAELKERLERGAAAIGLPELTRFMFDGPEEELRRTERTQPALFLVSAVLQDVLQERGVKPAMVAGHSLGEYVALYAAGVLDFDTALRLVGTRGRLMYEAGSSGGAAGAMAAVLGLDDDVIEKVVRETGGGAVVVANYNAPGQTVISGERDAVERVGEALKAAGARRVVPLQVSGAFHSPLVAGAAEKMAKELDAAQFRDARIPVVMNVDGKPHQGAGAIRRNLMAQMTGAVRWTDTVRALVAGGAKGLVEIGPGQVLAGLAKRIAKELPVHSVAGPGDVEALAGAGGAGAGGARG